MVVVQQTRELEWPASWEQAEVFARNLADGLGCPIDEGILETVVALNLLKFHTCQSCEGHTDEAGLPYPWIDFATGECPVWYHEAQAATFMEGLSAEEEEAAIDRLMAKVAAYHHQDHLYTRLTALLDIFYAKRATCSEEWRLILHCIHPGYYRLCSSAGYASAEWPAAIRSQNLKRAQHEMQEFTRFLKRLASKKEQQFV